MTHPSDNPLKTRSPEPRQWLTRALWIALLAGLALRPIAADDFWWHLARGRTVWQGTATPSATLLSLDTAREADWFGGVPLFVIFDVAGFHGLMLLRVVAVVATARVLIRLGGAGRSTWDLVTLAIGLAASSAACDATPRMFDLFGLLLVTSFGLRAGADRDRRWSPLVVLALWSNLATLPIVGWTLFAATRIDAAMDRREGVRSATKRLVLDLLFAAGACSLTPRGVFTLWDSLRLAVPRLVVDAAVLHETTWRPLVGSEWGLTEWAFVSLTAIAFLRMLKQPPALVWCVQLFAAATLGWINTASVPIAALWMTVLLIQFRRAGGLSSPAAPSSRAAVSRWRRVIPTTAFAGLTVMVWFPWPGLRPGWGLDPQLDHRILDATLTEARPQGPGLQGAGTLDLTAYADDVRSAGMCSWVTRGRIQPHDVPQRALLAGRLRDFVLLRHDLQWNRLSRYRREDDSWGGWWLPLRDRHTGLVLVAAEHTRLIRSLEPTIWKPLSLDSPVLPYGQAGDAGASGKIVEVLKQRAFVEDGPWVSSLLGPSGTDLSLDLWGFLAGASPNVEQELRQSRVFRAMHLPRAGLRVLLPCLRSSQADTSRHEFAMCNRDLGAAEVHVCGASSDWRAALANPDAKVEAIEFDSIRFRILSAFSEFRAKYDESALREWREIRATSDIAPFRLEVLTRLYSPPRLFRAYTSDRRTVPSMFPARWSESLDLARTGDLEHAIAVLDDELPGHVMLYARSCLARDAGQIENAIAELVVILQSKSLWSRNQYRILATQETGRVD